MTPSRSTLGPYAACVIGLIGIVGCHHIQKTPWPVVDPQPGAAVLIGEVRSTRNDSPIEHARVRLVALESSQRDSVTTDQWGKFVLGPIPPGEYRVEASMIGHRPISQDAHLSAGKVDTLRLQLQYAPAGLITDCISPDGRRIGSQYCRPH